MTDNLIKCPFCKLPFAAAQLVSHCKECPARRNSLQRPQQKQLPQKPQKYQPINESPSRNSNLDQPLSQQNSTAIHDIPSIQTHQEPNNTQERQQQIRKVDNQSPKQSAKSQSNPSEDEPLEQCQYCGRKFAQSRLGKHEQICQRSKSRKVKQFDINAKKFTDLDPEAQKLIKLSESKGILEKQKEIKQKYTVVEKRDNFTDAENVEMFGNIKPNFKPYSDDESEEKAGKKQSYKSPVRDFVPPTQGPIDENEHMHIGGPKLARTPTREQERAYDTPYRPMAQMEREDQEKSVELKSQIAKASERQPQQGAQQIQQLRSPSVEIQPIAQQNLRRNDDDASVNSKQRGSKRHHHKHRHSSKSDDSVKQMMQMMQQFMLTMRQGQVQPYQVQQWPQPQMQLPASQFASPGSAQYCCNCGSKFAENARFCQSCGSRRE